MSSAVNFLRGFKNPLSISECISKMNLFMVLINILNVHTNRANQTVQIQNKSSQDHLVMNLAFD